MRSATCLTEIREWDAQGRVVNVQLCRSPMRLSTTGAGHELGGPALDPTLWFWVCPNPRCGTAYPSA